MGGAFQLLFNAGIAARQQSPFTRKASASKAVAPCRSGRGLPQSLSCHCEKRSDEAIQGHGTAHAALDRQAAAGDDGSTAFATGAKEIARPLEVIQHAAVGHEKHFVEAKLLDPLQPPACLVRRADQ